MRTLCFTLLCLAGLASVSFATKNVLPYKKDVVVDGINKEWASPLPQYDKKTGLNFAVANNERNLYIIVRVPDDAVQKQIMQNGMEIWINRDGKKEKTTGVTFPIAPNQPEQQKMKKMRENNTQASRPPSDEKRENRPPAEKRGGLHRLPAELKLTGFLIENGRQRCRECPVRASLSQDSSHCLIYELAIPFNTFFKEILNEKDRNRTICIGFVVKSSGTTDQAANMDGMEMPGDMRNPGMRKPMGGGPGDMGGHIDGPDGAEGLSGRPTISSSEKTCWFKAALALP